MKKIILLLLLCFLFTSCKNEVFQEVKYTKDIANETLPIPIVNKYSGTYKSPIFVYGGVKTTRQVYVHYTLDGTEPIKLKSAWLGGGITITKSCTLKIKGFVSNTNECSPTLTVNYIIGDAFIPETFTYQDVLYKSRTTLGTGDCIYNTFDTLSITEPKVSNFECEGYFNRTLGQKFSDIASLISVYEPLINA